MIRFVDGILNHITMYRLALYYVGALLAAALVLGFFGMVPHDPAALALSTVFITAVCWITNKVFALVLRVPANTESIYITAFILALIMPPVTASDMPGLGGLALASIAAIASKFVLAIYRKHIFNPVAAGVVASSLLLDQPATWWVGGNTALLPIVVIGGLLILRKVQRFDMFTAYVATNLLATLFTAEPDMYSDALNMAVMSSPLLFAGFAMLTEPLTAPAARWPRLAFGAIVGALSVPAMHIGETYFTPELAFLAGNAFAWVVSPKIRFKLVLERIEKQAAGCYDYIFRSARPVYFKAGQYMDWTADVRSADNRGNRRAFTIASAPGAKEVRLGAKFYGHGSAFKQSLLNMQPGDVIYASQVAGSFVLPDDCSRKLAFLAGGIGVTPFRSMIEDMLHKGERRPVVMLYGNNRASEIAYADVFQRAEDILGVRTVYAVAEGGPHGTNMHQGYIDADMIQREMPDFRERMFYISGPRAMVTRFQTVLAELGIARSRIKTDYFPGFA